MEHKKRPETPPKGVLRENGQMSILHRIYPTLATFGRPKQAHFEQFWPPKTTSRTRSQKSPGKTVSGGRRGRQSAENEPNRVPKRSPT
jgi:hypothetical protein